MDAVLSVCMLPIYRGAPAPHPTLDSVMSMTRYHCPHFMILSHLRVIGIATRDSGKEGCIDLCCARRELPATTEVPHLRTSSSIASVEAPETPFDGCAVGVGIGFGGLSGFKRFQARSNTNQ